jgi:hypothetical protein
LTFEGAFNADTARTAELAFPDDSGAKDGGDTLDSLDNRRWGALLSTRVSLEHGCFIESKIIRLATNRNCTLKKKDFRNKHPHSVLREMKKAVQPGLHSF